MEWCAGMTVRSAFSCFPTAEIKRWQCGVEPIAAAAVGRELHGYPPSERNVLIFRSLRAVTIRVFWDVP
jgi:hypothetical protein